jgi:hypothetical protein
MRVRHRRSGQRRRYAVISRPWLALLCRCAQTRLHCSGECKYRGALAQGTNATCTLDCIGEPTMSSLPRDWRATNVAGWWRLIRNSAWPWGSYCSALIVDLMICRMVLAAATVATAKRTHGAPHKLCSRCRLRLSRHNHLYAFVNGDVLGEIARWLP